MDGTKTKRKIPKEEPQYVVQHQYESKFKADFSKTLILMNKAILQKITTDAPNKSTN